MFVEEHLKDVRAAGYSRAAWVAYGRRVAGVVRTQVWNNPQATRSVLLTGTALFVAHLLWALRLSFHQGPDFAGTYLTAAGLTTLAVTLLSLTMVGQIRTPDGVPCARLSPADWLSLARATMAPGILMFAAAREWRLAVVWMIVAGLTDVADGMLARALNFSTLFGRLVDPVVDVIFNTCLFVGLKAGGLVQWSLLGLVLLRYALVIFGGAYICVTRGPVRIQPTIFGKISGILVYLLLSARVALVAWQRAELVARAAGLLDLALLFLCAVTVFHVVGMGWANLKLTAAQLEPPKVLADVSFKPPRRREP